MPAGHCCVDHRAVDDSSHDNRPVQPPMCLPPNSRQTSRRSQRSPGPQSRKRWAAAGTHCEEGGEGAPQPAVSPAAHGASCTPCRQLVQRGRTALSGPHRYLYRSRLMPRSRRTWSAASDQPLHGWRQRWGRGAVSSCGLPLCGTPLQAPWRAAVGAAPEHPAHPPVTALQGSLEVVKVARGKGPVHSVAAGHAPGEAGGHSLRRGWWGS